MAQTTTDYWMIKHVDGELKRKVKGYAGAHGMTIAEALKRLVDLALANEK